MATVMRSTEGVSVADRAAESALVATIEGDVADLPRLIGEGFARTMAAIQAGGARVSGPPFARYLEFGPRVNAQVGFPFVGRLVPTAPLEIGELPGGRIVTTTHVGPYDEIGPVWDRAQGWIAKEGLTVAGPPWEVYLTGPDSPGPPVTQVVFPVVTPDA